MINIKRAEEVFLEYTKNYDYNDKNIAIKIGHSLRVMDISKKLAEGLKLREQIELATLIGLLHDIGRFEQQARFKTFRDVDSIDHGELGVKILEENNYIRRFSENNKYDNIIKKAIFNHNKYSIEDNLDEEELLFAKIIRDNDKIDILYEAETMFYKGEEEEVENSVLDEEIERQIKNKMQVIRRKGKSPLGINNVMATISFIYDINFKVSLQIIKDNNYIDKILDRFELKDSNTRQKVTEIRKDAEDYINSRIND